MPGTTAHGNPLASPSPSMDGASCWERLAFALPCAAGVSGLVIFMDQIVDRTQRVVKAALWPI